MSAPEGAPGRSSLARWRLAFRLARREFRRHPWRHTLVVLMIALPVLGAMVAFSAVSTIQRVEASESTYRDYGSDLRVSQWDVLTDEQLTRLRGAVPPGSRLETVRVAADWLGTDRDRTDGRGPVLVGTRTTEAPAAQAFRARFRVDTGRIPTGVDEIFLTQQLAALGGWVVGDQIESGRDVRTFTVVGVGAARDDLTAELAVLGEVPDTYWAIDLPGYRYVTLGDPSVPDGPDEYFYSARLATSTEVFVWLPAGSGIDAIPSRDDLSFQIEEVGTSPTQRLLAPGMALVFGALSAIVAIVASAAFAIASRRQLRSVGLLASAGADPGTIRAALVLQGAFPGLVAAGLALMIGLAGARIADSQGLLETLTHVDGAHTVISVGGIALAVVLGVLAGTMAAWMPARSASRVPVLSALAGRRPVGPVPNRVPLTGLAFVAAGGAGLALLVRRTTAYNGTDDLLTTATPLLMIATVLAMLFGLIALAPTLVAVVGSLSHRVTGTTRIALRGIARHRSQSAAAVAAVAICLAVPVGVLTTKASLDAEEARERVEDSWSVGSEMTQDTAPAEVAEPVASVRSEPGAMAVRVIGDLTSPELDPLVAEVEAVTGPVTRVPFITFSDGAGGWYPVAAIAPEAAGSLLAPWAAEQIQAGRAISLRGTPGPVTLDDDVNRISLEAVAAPGGGAVSLTAELDADYLVPAGVLEQVAVGRPPLDLLLLRPEPLSRVEAEALEQIWMRDFPGDSGTEIEQPTLAELREVLQQAGNVPLDPVPDDAPASIFEEPDVRLSVEYSQFSEVGTAPAPELPPGIDRPTEDQTFQRWLRIVALVAGALSLLVLTITLSLRAVDSVDDHRAAIAAGAAPARIRRQHALEGMVLASLGALLAIPLGWLPVTAVRFGQVRRQYGPDAGSSIEAVTTRLHLPGWEVVPILVLPIVAVGVLWLVAPLLRSLVQRGPVDQVLPRY